MLEFKNASVMLPGGRESKPFSLVVNDGEMVCLCGGEGSGKSLLLKAVLGLWPVAKGFMTFDGEIISPGSSAYFRDMIAYIPQDLPTGALHVRELFHDIMQHGGDKAKGPDMKGLMAEWQRMGISNTLVDKPLDKIDHFTLQLMLLSFLPMLKKKIILIDNITQTAAIHSFLLQLAADGAEIIYTCRDNKMDCNKIVNL